jgi:hypothetical protein
MTLGQGSALLPLRVRFQNSSLDVRVVSDTGRFDVHNNLRRGEDGLFLLEITQEVGETRVQVLLNAWDGKPVGARFELKLPLPTPGVRVVAAWIEEPRGPCPASGRVGRGSSSCP